MAILVGLRPVRRTGPTDRGRRRVTGRRGSDDAVSLRVLWRRTVGAAVVLTVVTGIVALLASAYQRALLVDTTSQVRLELVALMDLEEALEGFDTPASGLMYGLDGPEALERQRAVFDRVRATVDDAFVDLSGTLEGSQIAPRAAETWAGIERAVLAGPDMVASGSVSAALAANEDPFRGSVWEPLRQLESDMRGMRETTLQHFDAQTAAATRVQRLLTASLAVAVAATVAVTSRATRRMHRAVVDPLLQLQEATHELAATEDLRPVRLPGAVHELQQLAATFNQSAMSLGARRDQLRVQAATDDLTGLLTRAAFVAAVQAMLNDPSRRPAVVFLDVDDFKRINDTCGHAVGDEVLRAVSARIMATIRDGDHAGRLGGDEFAVLIDCAAREDAAIVVAHRLVDALGRQLPLAGGHVAPACSIGVAHATGPTGAEDLLRHADLAMYTAKRAGKDRVAVHAAPASTAARPSLSADHAPRSLP